MKAIRAVIFDMDGLLIDSERVVLWAFEQACLELDLQIDPRTYLQCIGRNQRAVDATLAKAIGTATGLPKLRACWEGHYRNKVAALPTLLKPGVVELLKSLRQLNLPLAVATSTNHSHATSRLEKEGIHHFFAAIVGGDQVNESKPKPEIYLKAAAALNVAPSDALALEDSENGVRAAVAAGMTVCQIPDLIQPNEAFRKQLGHHVLPELSVVFDYFFRLNLS
jgi:HAD superfamily hydrolase (TIGR01509 family)